MDGLREPRPPNENASPCWQQGEAPETLYQNTTNNNEYSPRETLRQDHARTFLGDLLNDVDSPNRFVLVAFGEGVTLGVWHAQASDLSVPIATLEEWNAGGGNVYWGAALMDPDLPPEARGGKVAIREMLAVVVDIDDAEAAGRVDAALEKGAWPLGLMPSRIVRTSGTPTPRYQLVWLLKEPSEDLTLWERVAHGLHEAWGDDDCTKDPVHVWRVPGFTNWPHAKKRAAGRVPELAELLPQEGERWDLEELAERLPEDTAPDTVPDETPPDALSPEVLPADTPTRFADAHSVQDIARFLPQWLREDLKGTAPAADRSKLDYQIASEMAAHGFLPGDLLRLYELGLRDGHGFADKVRERCAQGDEAVARYLLSTWTRAHSERKARGEPMIARHPLEWEVAATPPETAERRARTSRREEAFRLVFPEEFKDRKPPPYLIKGILSLGGIAAIGGQPKSGKTYAVLDLCLRVASGAGWWLGRRTASGPVVYVIAENAGDFEMRVNAALKESGLSPETLPLALFERALSLGDDYGEVDRFIDMVRASKRLGGPPKLVVIDTLSRSFSGDENSAEDMRKAMDACAVLSVELDAAVLLVHHTPKRDDETLRGSGVLGGDLDATLIVKKDKEGRRTLRVAASRIGPEGDECAFSLKPVILGTDNDGDPIEIQLFQAGGSLSQRTTAAPTAAPANKMVANRPLAEWAADVRAIFECAQQDPPPDLLLPPGRQVVSLKHLRRALGLSDGDSGRDKFNKVRNRLEEAEIIGCHFTKSARGEGWAWLS